MLEILRARAEAMRGAYYHMFKAKLKAQFPNLSLEDYFVRHTPVRHYTHSAYYVTAAITALERLENGDPEGAKDALAGLLVFAEQSARDGGKSSFPWSLTLQPPEPALAVNKENMDAKPSGTGKLAANIARTVDPRIYTTAIAAVKDITALHKFRQEAAV